MNNKFIGSVILYYKGNYFPPVKTFPQSLKQKSLIVEYKQAFEDE